MAVSIKVSRDFGPLGIKLTQQDLRDVGDLLVRRIQTRTQSGVDVHGAGFRGYNTDYAKAKREAVGHSRVDLTVSGRMLNDMQVVEATDHSATISFISAGGGGGGGTFIQRSRSMGAADKAEFNNPTREFFGASTEDEQAIAEALDRVLQARLDKQE